MTYTLNNYGIDYMLVELLWVRSLTYINNLQVIITKLSGHINLIYM